jgi:hypothetical protein
MKMLDAYLLHVKSRKQMKDIKVRLQEYIDFTNATKRFSDAGFYEELLDYIQRLEKQGE